MGLGGWLSPESDKNGPILSENGDVRGLPPESDSNGPFLSDFREGRGKARGADDACLRGRDDPKAGFGALWAVISLVCGRFEWLHNARWLIYGTGTRICQVPALRFRASYLRYHVLRAMYKPLSKTQTPESAMHRTVGGCVGRFCLAGAWGGGAESHRLSSFGNAWRSPHPVFGQNLPVFV